jgi:hypothetical protein
MSTREPSIIKEGGYQGVKRPWSSDQPHATTDQTDQTGAVPTIKRRVAPF